MAWTTLANVKQWLQITDSSQDSFLTSLLARSQDILEKYLGRTIESANYTEYHDGDESDTVLVDVFPIISVTSVYDDPARLFGADTLVDAADYTFYPKEGTIRKLGEVVFSRGARNVKVVYTAGYAAVPASCEQAQIMHIAWLKNRQNTEGMTSQSFGGKSETYDDSEIPLYIRSMIRHYKKIGV